VDLRARLAALGVGSASRLLETAEPIPRGERRPLVEEVGGAVRSTSTGDFLVVERTLPLDLLHGRVVLREALAHRLPIRARERGPDGPQELDLGRAVFLDTETTGLSGGTGTVAFLVGTGRVVGDGFVVRQYAIRDYPDEPAMLHALEEDLGDSPLVTFNGRAFDWPLLTTRWALQRTRPSPRTHVDLLPTARRLWASSLPSRSLSTLERHVLGLERPDDLPGWRIPGAWFDYLRTGRAEEVARAFRHNETDVVSMLALLARVAAILLDPGAVRHADSSALGAARFLLEIGDVAGARRRLEAALEDAVGPETRKARTELGRLLRNLGRHEEALAHWIGAAHGPSPDGDEFDAEAYTEVAKICERRLRDPVTALRWVEEALERCPPSSPCQADFLRRADRLRRRVQP
jgi:uncharacterized protein YprB with RNaseH-like and TPR domain